MLDHNRNKRRAGGEMGSGAIDWPAEVPALRPGRVHEATGPAAGAFAAIAAAARTGPVIWIAPPRARDRPDPYGLAALLDPARLLLLTPSEPLEALWAMEEALRSGAAPTVIAECARPPDLTQSRRLQLAAEAGGRDGPAPIGLALIPAAQGTTAAETRWRIEPAPPADAGRARPPPTALWRWRLTKNKRGPLGDWLIGWRDPRAPAVEGGGGWRRGTRNGAPDPVPVVAALGGGTRNAA